MMEMRAFSFHLSTAKIQLIMHQLFHKNVRKRVVDKILDQK